MKFNKQKGETKDEKSRSNTYCRAPVRCLTHNGWKSHLVRSNQSLVSSLGTEMVTLGLSVGKKEIEP